MMRILIVMLLAYVAISPMRLRASEILTCFSVDLIIIVPRDWDIEYEFIDDGEPDFTFNTESGELVSSHRTKSYGDIPIIYDFEWRIISGRNFQVLATRNRNTLSISAVGSRKIFRMLHEGVSTGNSEMITVGECKGG